MRINTKKKLAQRDRMRAARVFLKEKEAEIAALYQEGLIESKEDLVNAVELFLKEKRQK